MRVTGFARFVAAAAFAIASAGANAGPVYVTSGVNKPWDLIGNEVAMDSVFGAGGWTAGDFETVDAMALFSAANDFIFLEIGDNATSVGSAFISANEMLLSAWVSNGGRLLVNGASNQGAGYNFGLGVSNIESTFGDGIAAGPHPIFDGPASPVGSAWSGNSFSHAALDGGGLSAIILEQGTGAMLLGEKTQDAGLAVFGTLTLPFFNDDFGNTGITHPLWQPQPEVANLHCNIIAYTAGVSTLAAGQCGGAQAVPAPALAPLLVLGIGLFGLVSCGRRTAA